jgi:hypothetical protein
LGGKIRPRHGRHPSHQNQNLEPRVKILKPAGTGKKLL